MFNLFKKSNKKKEISTETMSIQEYSAAIRPKVIEAWNDPYVAERITTKTIFDEGAKVNPGVSFEELKEMDARLIRAIAIGNEFRHRFDEKLEKVANDEITEEKARKFLTATNIVEMIADVNRELPVVYPENDTRNAESIKKGINSTMKIMQNIYNVTIETEVLCVKNKRLHLEGFK